MSDDGAAGSTIVSGVGRIVAVRLDAATLGHVSAAVAHERDIAIRDLIDVNRFAPRGRPATAWALEIGLRDQRLILGMSPATRDTDADALQVSLALAQLRRLIRDYYETCDSYYAAVRTAPAEAVEAIDVERRAIHDRGAALLTERLAEIVDLDTETARRLFTLVATLFWTG